jgi:NAD(P)-dependent dehydrogenase (short-subunit alcohol dehydrogenase family)
MNIENKTILITGANRGIGRALVDEALRRGAKRIYAGARSGELQTADNRVTPLTLDVTSVSQIQRAVEKVDTLDVLINNAGVAIYDDLSNLEVIEKHLAVNFLGLLKVTHAFLSLLRRSKGAIVNNLSLAALAPLPVIPSYSMSKAAAFNMTQSLRALLASKGVTVHAVVLGPIDTDMNRGFEIPKASPESAAVWRKVKTRSFPIQRLRPSRRAGAPVYPKRSNASSPLTCRKVWRSLRSARLSATQEWRSIPHCKLKELK